jgi:hypothetical protein
MTLWRACLQNITPKRFGEEFGEILGDILGSSQSKDSRDRSRVRRCRPQYETYTGPITQLQMNDSSLTSSIEQANTTKCLTSTPPRLASIKDNKMSRTRSKRLVSCRKRVRIKPPPMYNTTGTPHRHALILIIHCIPAATHTGRLPASAPVH